jgi:hypothetical protein
MQRFRFSHSLVCLILATAILSGCRTPAVDEQNQASESAAAAAEAAPQITFGNGESNWIVTDGMTRADSTLTFSEVQIAGNGWLVLHPFKDGKPVGEIYVGSTYLSDGANRNVEISVESGIEAGDMFLVMLHSDVNENREFDFVFVDARNVLDKAVFEGTRMIAHPISAP